MTAIEDAELKVDRAERQIAELVREFEAWAKTQPTVVIDEHDPETGWHKFRLEPLPEPPCEWVMVVGEICYNLRAALNYLVVDLIIANGRKPSKSTQFPIFSGSPTRESRKRFAGQVAGDEEAFHGVCVPVTSGTAPPIVPGGSAPPSKDAPRKTSQLSAGSSSSAS